MKKKEGKLSFGLSTEEKKKENENRKRGGEEHGRGKENARFREKLKRGRETGNSQREKKKGSTKKRDHVTEKREKKSACAKLYQEAERRKLIRQTYKGGGKEGRVLVTELAENPTRQSPSRKKKCKEKEHFSLSAIEGRDYAFFLP